MKTLRSLLSGTFLQNPVDVSSDINCPFATTLSQSFNFPHFVVQPFNQYNEIKSQLLAKCLHLLPFFFISKNETRFVWLYLFSIKFCLPGLICIIALCNCGILKDSKYFYISLVPGSPVHSFHFLPFTLLTEYFQILPRDVMTQQKSMSTSQTSPLGPSSLSGFPVIKIYWF